MVNNHSATFESLRNRIKEQKFVQRKAMIDFNRNQSEMISTKIDSFYFQLDSSDQFKKLDKASTNDTNKFNSSCQFEVEEKATDESLKRRSQEEDVFNESFELEEEFQNNNQVGYGSFDGTRSRDSCHLTPSKTAPMGDFFFF